MEREGWKWAEQRVWKAVQHKPSDPTQKMVRERLGDGLTVVTAFTVASSARRAASRDEQRARSAAALTKHGKRGVRASDFRAPTIDGGPENRHFAQAMAHVRRTLDGGKVKSETRGSVKVYGLVKPGRARRCWSNDWLPRAARLAASPPEARSFARNPAAARAARGP